MKTLLRVVLVTSMLGVSIWSIWTIASAWLEIITWTTISNM